MDAEELDEDWRRACRANQDLNRFGEPAPSPGLVAGVLSRIQGAGHPPNSVLHGLAVGFASSGWETSPKAVFLQLATLVSEASKPPRSELGQALEVLTVLGDATAGSLVDVWRGEAETDGLTALGNRRRMESVTRDFVKDQVPFEYASIDVDGLKAVNDTKGHAVGDQLLKDVAKHLREYIPSAATAFRYGGDEFGVVMRLVQVDGHRLTQVLEEGAASLPPGVSFSWGVSTWPEDDPDISTVIAHADKQMYDQKIAKKRADEDLRESTPK